MPARRDKQKRLAQVSGEQERARRNRAEKAAREAARLEGEWNRQCSLLERQARDAGARAAARQKFEQLSEEVPKHKQALIEVNAPLSLKSLRSAKQWLGWMAKNSLDVITVAVYLHALAQSIGSSQLASGNAAVASDMDFIASRVPAGEYAYVCFAQAGSIDYSPASSPDDGSISSLPLLDGNSVHVGNVPPLVDPTTYTLIPIEGRLTADGPPAPPAPTFQRWLYDNDPLRTLRPDQPISRELADQIEAQLNARRRQRAKEEQHSELPADERIDPTLVSDVPDPAAPAGPLLFADAPPDVPEDGGDDGEVAIASVPTFRAHRASAAAAPQSFASLVAEVLAHGHHPPPVPNHPEFGLPSVARALDQVEERLRKAARDDEEVRPSGLLPLMRLLAQVDEQMRPFLHARGWLVGADPYRDMLCCGHWRSASEPEQLGDVVFMADPTIPGGVQVGIALSDHAAQWITADSRGSWHVRQRSPAAVRRRAWQPIPRGPFNEKSQIGAVWGAAGERLRALLERCYANDTAVDGDLVGHIAAATGIGAQADVAALSRAVVGQLHAVTRQTTALWPGAVVFGRDGGEVGLLLPDGRVLGTFAGNPFPAQVVAMTTHRFQPRFVWYPGAPVVADGPPVRAAAAQRQRKRPARRPRPTPARVKAAPAPAPPVPAAAAVDEPMEEEVVAAWGEAPLPSRLYEVEPDGEVCHLTAGCPTVPDGAEVAVSDLGRPATLRERSDGRPLCEVCLQHFVGVRNILAEHEHDHWKLWLWEDRGELYRQGMLGFVSQRHVFGYGDVARLSIVEEGGRFALLVELVDGLELMVPADGPEDAEWMFERVDAAAGPIIDSGW